MQDWADVDALADQTLAVARWSDSRFQISGALTTLYSHFANLAQQELPVATDTHCSPMHSQERPCLGQWSSQFLEVRSTALSDP